MASDKLYAEWFWIDRWVGSSAFGLPISARGLYREMLTQAWRRGAVLPNDFDQIRRFVGVTKTEWARSWPLVERFWRVDGDTLVNDTQLEVYAEAQGRQRRAFDRAMAGVEAARKMRDRLHLSRHSSATQVPTQVPTQVGTQVQASVSVSDHRSKNKEQEREKERVSLPPPAADPFLNDDVTKRAGAFIEHYQDLYLRHRHGARYAVKPQRDYAAAVTLCTTWLDDHRLEKLAVIFLTTDHKFAEEGSRTIPQFLALASWADGRLAAHEARKASA